MNVFVDTSIWLLALRRRRKSLSTQQRRIERELTDLITQGRVVLIGPVRQEVLSGLRDEQVFDRLREYLRFFDDEVLSFEDFEEAARGSNRCRAKGIAAPPVDMVSCAVAVRRDLAIFTTDVDFQQYAKHLPIHLHSLAQHEA